MAGLDDLKKFSDSVIPKKDVVELIKKFKTKDERSLMVKIASEFTALARAPISNFLVSIVAKEKETGDLIIGGNLEFAGAPLGQTVHAEQFVFARAFHRGNSVDSIALGKPTPCGHCRQFIFEFAGGKNVRMFNASGLEFRIGDALPFGFGPEDLKEKGVIPGSIDHGLNLSKKTKSELADAALAVANMSYCPYSKTPSGVALKAKSEIFSGAAIENAAFNPSLSPLHSALINLAASGGKWSDIKEVVLAQGKGSVDHASVTEAFLKTIAPKAKFSVVEVK